MSEEKAKINKGLEPKTVALYKSLIRHSRYGYMPSATEAVSDDLASFYFIAPWHGQEVIFSATLYTLRFHLANRLFEKAEELAEAEFHTFKSKQCIQGDPCAAFTESEQHMAEWVLRKVEELENLRLIQVQEHIHLDPEADFGIGLEIGLNVERINPFVINRLVCDFKAGTFQPDDTRYSHFPD